MKSEPTNRTTSELKLVPLDAFKFQNYDGPMRPGEENAPAHATLTCINHDFLRWSTKNPYQRSIHYLGVQAYWDYVSGKVGKLEIPQEHMPFMYKECHCSFDSLRVIVEE